MHEGDPRCADKEGSNDRLVAKMKSRGKNSGQPIFGITPTAMRWIADHLSVRVTGFVLLSCGFLAIYWLAARDARVHGGGDTTAFEEVARTQLSWANILSTQRPPIYPLLFWLLDFSRPVVVLIQTASYLVSWIFLAAMLGKRNMFVAACVFYVALFPGFAAWNHVLMSESLATSLTVVGFAFLVRVLECEGWAFWGFIAVICLRCLLRGFDSILCFFYLPVLVLAATRHRTSWSSVAYAVLALLLCFVIVNRTTGGPHDGVWFFALLNNVGTRALPDPGWRQYFVAHGMPLNDALLSMTGRLAHELNMRFFIDQELAGFRAWALAHGRSTYVLYLLAHPSLIVSGLWQARAEVFLADGIPPMPVYFDPGYRLTVPPWPSFVWVYVSGALGSALLATLLSRRRVPSALAAQAGSAVLLWLSLLPLALCVYHADAGEIPRHAIPILLQAALCVVWMIQIVTRVCAVDPDGRNPGKVAAPNQVEDEVGAVGDFPTNVTVV
jgi:hypothetical protein